MTILNFKELGIYGKALQVISFHKIYHPKNLPQNNKKEIVFWGKSNVGKSTLINTLLNYKINKVSKKPGCTKWIGLLELPHVNIIDLPGYGYSKVAKGRKEFWDQMLSDYIKLKRSDKIFILIDNDRDISELDHTAAKCFQDIPKEFIFTKADHAENSAKKFLVSTKTGLNIVNFREKIAKFS